MKPQNKKDLIAAYKQRAQIGGIYAVTNKETGKSLVLAMRPEKYDPATLY